MYARDRIVIHTYTEKSAVRVRKSSWELWWEDQPRQSRPATSTGSIHVLPSEIMVHIFQLVLDAQQCYYVFNDSAFNSSAKSPEILSHVCSRWRQIALGTQSFWSHIDLALLQSRSRFKGLLARGELFATRAGNLPLNIHILGGLSDWRERGRNADPDLHAFFAPVATRIGRLELLANCEWQDYGHRIILEHCLSHCAPEVLNELVTVHMGLYRFRFMCAGPRGHNSGRPTLHLNVSEQHLEDLLLPVKVLRLDGLCPPWSSKAYHGLVDLQLTSYSSFPPCISQLEFATILAASPGLRQLRFRFEIRDPIPSSSPVVLNDLEVLSIGPLNSAQQDDVLQMIAPGSGSLKVSLQFDEDTLALPLLPSDKFAMFMARSNVTQLSINKKHATDGNLVFRWLPQLLRVTRSLQMICLTGFDLLPNQHHPLEQNPPGVDINKLRPVGSPIDCLRLTDCSVIMDEFRHLIKVFPIQKLELEGCSIYSTHPVEFDLNELAEIFPVSEFIDGPRPINPDHRELWYSWD